MGQSAIAELTPHMVNYRDAFSDTGSINWLPYLMFFHPFNHSSETVCTDSLGFRYSEALGRRYSVDDGDRRLPARLLAGSSTVFGIGASADRHTLSSRLTENDERPEPWINFGGRSYNSTQELILFTLYRHLLPPIREIVLFSGFNNLGLAQLPQQIRGENGAFFLCRNFFDALSLERPSRFGSWFRREKPFLSGHRSNLTEQIAYAANLTVRHLAVWRALALDMGATLTFVLQPLANWVRPVGCREETRLFAELEKLGAFADTYGDILTPKCHSAYAAIIRDGAEALGVRFVDLSPLLADRADAQQWLFVDRIHFTDDGHDFVARVLLETLCRSSK
jgi:hypothetical protein